MRGGVWCEVSVRSGCEGWGVGVRSEWEVCVRRNMRSVGAEWVRVGLRCL